VILRRIFVSSVRVNFGDVAEIFGEKRKWMVEMMRGKEVELPFKKYIEAASYYRGVDVDVSNEVWEAIYDDYVGDTDYHEYAYELMEEWAYDEMKEWWRLRKFEGETCDLERPEGYSWGFGGLGSETMKPWGTHKDVYERIVKSMYSYAGDWEEWYKDMPEEIEKVVKGEMSLYEIFEDYEHVQGYVAYDIDTSKYLVEDIIEAYLNYREAFDHEMCEKADALTDKIHEQLFPDDDCYDEEERCNLIAWYVLTDKDITLTEKEEVVVAKLLMTEEV
jgi:hypothetical protein